MSTHIAALIGVVTTLLAVAWGCYWKSRSHFAKAEVYQEFADTFSGMRSMHYKRGREKFMASQQAHMRLALVDPLVRDGLRAALEDADRYWTEGAGE